MTGRTEGTGRIDSITAPDGTPLAIEWVYPGAGGCTWMRDTEHFCDPILPAELWCYAVCGPGIDRAWTEADLLPSASLARWQFAGPFLYFRVTSNPPERVAEAGRRITLVRERYGTPLAFWREFCEPRIIAVCEGIAAAPPEADPIDLAERWAYGWHQTFTSLSPLFFELGALIELLTPAFGDGAELLANEVAQGGTNASQAIDAEVWALAELVRADEEVHRLVTRGTPAEAVDALMASVSTPAPAPAPATRRVAEGFAALLARHDVRSEGWSVDRLTWGECPSLAMALVRAQLHEGAMAPAEVASRSRRLKDAAIDRALTALPLADHERFHELAASVDGNVEIREGRAYWQMVLAGQLRRWLLRLGDRLVAEGRLARPGDVLFLTPPEIDATPGWFGAIADRRRAEYDQWRTFTPPWSIGLLDHELTQQPSSTIDELGGLAASRGVFTGTARVIRDLDDWDLMEPGEILVCPFTTPAWTPLFGLAAAIVTESGDATSHPSITAREYGIPAVVGVPDACSRIASGDVITVDGTTGVVRLTK